MRRAEHSINFHLDGVGRERCVLNIELLLKVREAILREPDSYDQNTFGDIDHAAPCGTVCCIAGHTLIEAGEETMVTLLLNEKWEIAERAQAVLGLTLAQRHRLFHPSALWPEPFASQMREARAARRPIKLARIAAARIDKFIETEGAV